MSPEVESVGSEGTAAPVETSAPDTSEVTAGGVPEKDNGEAAAAAAAAAQYTPNYKFRAADKDHEIPEHFRGLMKDAKAEKEIKELSATGRWPYRKTPASFAPIPASPCME